MYVLKRNGRREAVNLNKITERLKRLKYLNDEVLQVDEILVAQKVVAGLYDGVTTKELDTLAAETAAGMVMIHNDYDRLAARIEVSNIHKETDASFSKNIESLRLVGIVDGNFNDYVQKYNTILDAIIADSRDYLFDFFGVRTLKRAYLLKDKQGKIIERPQHMWLRVASFIHGEDFERVKETYEYLSTKKFTHATPTLFNAGTVKPQLSSCFLLDIADDSIEGIYKTLSDCAKISQSAGGIGLAIHKIRASGSYIAGTNGVSNGIIPMLRVFDATARYVDQGGGKRKGSIAVYLEPWHADIFEFLDLKKNHGKEELRARDLFYALWIPDLFMRRVEEDGEWTLFDPKQTPELIEAYGETFGSIYQRLERINENKTGQETDKEVQIRAKRIRARDLWDRIITSQIETGTPYMLYKDACNLKSNQQNIGTIKSSNLCVTGDTKLLTSTGYVPIKELWGRTVKVWNGEEFTETRVLKTGTNQKILKVTLSNGAVLKCTEYHKWYLQNTYHGPEKEVRTKELVVGDRLVKFDLPFLRDGWLDLGSDYYTHGAFCADGTYSSDRDPRLSLYSYKKELIPFLDIRSSSYKEDASGRINLQLHRTLPEKFKVPHNAPYVQKLQWLAGYLDFDGCLTNNQGTQSIQVASIELEFLNEIRLLLHTLGVHSKVVKAQEAGLRILPDGKGGRTEFNCKKTDRLLIAESGVQRLLKLGIKFRRLAPEIRTPNRDAAQFVKVVKIENSENEDTWCVAESKRGKVVFNGILTGNCTEILEYTSPTETAVCNLASIALSQFVTKDNALVDYVGIYKAARTLVRNLDNVIELSFYPTKEAEYSNRRHRPIGIGVQGLADLFAKLKLSFDCEEARTINKRVFETIYKGAVDESINLARERGTYETYQGSPASHGRLQFDLWGIDRSELFHDWTDTFYDLSRYGLRNSLLVAPMPTASTAQILGNNEAFEPFTSNIYLRRTLSGEFIVVNKYLVEELREIGLWTEAIRNTVIASNGSIQQIHTIPNSIRLRYRTVFEIPQKSIIDMAADRGVYIDQSQSLNLFVNDPTPNKLTSMHFYGWKKGLKTGQYYLRTNAAVDAIKFTVEKEKAAETVESEAKYCSLDNPEDCEACGS